jgi:asparagine synthase (glutamine-hydrolysing)
MPTWLDGDWFQRNGAVSGSPFDAANAAPDLVAELVDACTVTSLPMLLRYADRNAMAVSLENRVPFLTTALADFALSLPDELLIDDEGTTKSVLRRAMRGIVPDPILDRRDKIGFSTPESRWFRESPVLRRQLGSVASDPPPGCFCGTLVSQLRAVSEGRAPYTAYVWRCWNVIRWAQLLRLEFPA